MVERVATGVPGLDDLLHGGLPKESVLLISGGAGAGKTIACCQFLWQGLQDEENCLYITLEEDADRILADARQFGMNFEEYWTEDPEAHDQFNIEYMDPFRGEQNFTAKIVQQIQEIEADRVVVDSTSVMGMYTDSTGEVRKDIYNLIRRIREQGATCVLTAEIPRGSHKAISRYGVEEFVADGVIVLRTLGVSGEMGRRLRIEKMRRTPVPSDIYPLEFGDAGLVVKEPEKGLSL